MAWGLIGAAALGAGASIYSANQAASSQASANQMSLDIAREQMKFQKMMYNHRFRATVHDLQKAGLNPALATTAALSGSIPQGAGASFKSEGEVSSQIISQGLGNTANTVAEIMKKLAETDKIKTETEAMKPSANIGAALDVAMKSGMNEAKSASEKLPTYAKKVATDVLSTNSARGAGMTQLGYNLILNYLKGIKPNIKKD